MEKEDYTVKQYEFALSNAKLPENQRKQNVGFAANKFWGFNTFENLDVTHIKISEQNVFKYSILEMASEQYTYRTTVFVNNDIAKIIDGYDCIETDAGLSEYAMSTIELDISEYTDEVVVIYAIAVPVSCTDENWTRALKTDTLALIIE